MVQPTYEELTDLVSEQAETIARQDDVIAKQAAIIEQLQAEVDALTEKLEIMHHRVSQMSRRIFANTSERYDDPNQQVLPLVSGMEAVVADLSGDDDDDDEPPSGGGERKGKKRKNRGRLKIPDTVDVVEKRIEPPPEQRTDAEGRILPQIGVEVSEQLDYRAGGWVKLLIERPVYGAPYSEAEDRAIAPLPPRIVPRGLPTDETVIQVVCAKYQHHQPLYRQAQEMAEYGIDLGRSTLLGWVRRAANLWRPVVDAIGRSVLESPVLHSDDTPIPLLDPGRGRAATGRMWIYRTTEEALFRFTRTRAGAEPQNFLADYHGTVVADAYPGYDALFGAGRAQEAACWAHTRRYFFEAAVSGDEGAEPFLDAIRRLYAFERAWADHPPDRQREARQRHAKPILNDLRPMLDQVAYATLPRSPLGRAVRYARDQWDALNVYLDDGRVPIDNNNAENSIRPLALGRKNFLFVGSDDGGEWAATAYSLIESCRITGVVARTYLAAITDELLNRPGTDPAGLTPRRWAEGRRVQVA